MTEPTDADLQQLWQNSNPTNFEAISFARAVLARWGQPSGAVPLTPEQISAMSRKHPAEDLCGWSYAMGITDAEAAHGIKAKEAGNAD